MQRSPLYTILFATAVCIVCAIVVSTSAVSLKERQDINAALEKQRNVLQAAGLMELRREARRRRRSPSDSRTSRWRSSIWRPASRHRHRPRHFDQAREAKDPATSTPAPPNPSLVKRLPNHALVYKVLVRTATSNLWFSPSRATASGSSSTDSSRSKVISTQFAASPSTNTVRRRAWEARSTTRDGNPAGSEERSSVTTESPRSRSSRDSRRRGEEAPYKVDGLSGATLTSRGSDQSGSLLARRQRLWPYLEKIEQRKAT